MGYCLVYTVLDYNILESTTISTIFYSILKIVKTAILFRIKHDSDFGLSPANLEGDATVKKPSYYPYRNPYNSLSGTLL